MKQGLWTLKNKLLKEGYTLATKNGMDIYSTKVSFRIDSGKLKIVINLHAYNANFFKTFYEKADLPIETKTEGPVSIENEEKYLAIADHTLHSGLKFGNKSEI